MFPAAFASLHNPAPKGIYGRERAEGKRHNAALTCLARRRRDANSPYLATASLTSPPGPHRISLAP